MGYDDPNRPERHRLPRSDEPRMLGPADSGDLAQDGYWVRARRPRVAGYPDLVSPERASRIEGIVSDFDDMMVSDE